ncbi:hypothetical protein HDU76_001255 [Blyttiomyces sp. JEL0837]|nr:hypothetical protein HDU76_001255 [Blyttiomyces sp. JEL0837]
MATRSKTLLFLQYRSSFGRTAKPSRHAGGVDTSEQAGLIANDLNTQDVVLEMSILPPKWVDIVDEVDEDIEQIKLRITELESLHKKNLLPGFDDRIGSEQSIERLSDSIMTMFQVCQKKIKRINADAQNTDGNKQTAVLGKNIQVSLTAKLQEISLKFRKAQSAYINKLRGTETRSKAMFQAGTSELAESSEDEALDAVFTDAQMALVADNDRAISERETQINDIVKSINGLAEVFKELQTLVIDQGTVLDRIDYNIEQVNVHMENAHVQLTQGSKYQAKTKAKLVAKRK